MRIIFDHSNADSLVNRAADFYGAASLPPETNRGERAAAALDLSGMKAVDDAYGESSGCGARGKTMWDIMESASQMDATAMKNCMAVMANTMSGKDFAKFCKEGFEPGSVEGRTMVTILDRIKVELKKAGVEVVGFNDDLDSDVLKEVTKSQAYANELAGERGRRDELVRQFDRQDLPLTEENVKAAQQAYAKAQEVDGLSEDAQKYMVRNEMDPTIDNLYIARYSGAKDGSRQAKGYYSDGFPGYYARKAEEFDWEKLEPQMRQVADEAGLSGEPAAMEEARWLVERGIPLTKDSLGRLHSLRQLEFPLAMEQVLAAEAAAAADGKGPDQGNLLDTDSDIDKAVRYAEETERLTGRAVDKAAASGQPVTLGSLWEAQRELDAQSGEYAGAGRSGEALAARRQLEEIRLHMTAEANLKLIRSGFSVDTAPMEELIAQLRKAEEECAAALYGEKGQQTGGTPEPAASAELYARTAAVTAAIPGMPAAVIGQVAESGLNFSLDDVYESGKLMQETYRRAGESYETLMTAPRRDLGDSIAKAFRNVDDILADLGLETTDDNRKAVRILGYNRMEIDRVSVEKVRTALQEVSQAVDRLSPSAVLGMIREGRNPLSMQIDELRDYLDSRDADPVQATEKYSKFLYKLEKNGEITPEERDSYIGIYRLFRQLEKTDGAAIGALIGQGAELTVKNLLSAMRSGKKRGMDVPVDDDFGGSCAAAHEPSISEQIESGFSYYRGLSGEIYRELEPEKLRKAGVDDRTGLEELAQALRQEETDSKLEADYRALRLQELREAGKAEEAVYRLLLDNRQPVTADNLAAAGELRNDRGGLFRKGREIVRKLEAKPADNGGTVELSPAVDEAVRAVQEEMTGREETQRAYGELSQALSQVLVTASEEGGRYVDLKAIGLLQKQLSLAAGLSREEHYEIPVYVEGQLTAVNLTIVRDGEKAGQAAVSMETGEYGKLTAVFRIKGDSLTGRIETDRTAGEGLSGIRDAMCGKAAEHGFAQARIDLSAGAGYAGEQTESRAETDGGGAEAGDVSDARLYETAKWFIGLIAESGDQQYATA